MLAEQLGRDPRTEAGIPLASFGDDPHVGFVANRWAALFEKRKVEDESYRNRS